VSLALAFFGGALLGLAACADAPGSTGPDASANRPPTASVDDQSVTVGDAVAISGAGSADPEGAALRYEWSLRVRPGGSVAAVDAREDVARFIADVVGVYVVDLVVTDGVHRSARATALVTASDSAGAPIADAGPDKAVFMWSTVELDGSASSDPGGLPLEFRWEVVDEPSGAALKLEPSDGGRVRFVAAAVGEIVVALVVDNGTLSSAADAVRITVMEQDPVALDVPRGVLHASEVYGLGAVRVGVGDPYVLFQYRDPRYAAAGFPDHLELPSLTLSPAGVLLYTRINEWVLREFHCDGCPGFGPGEGYPSGVIDNDPVLSTPPCETTDVRDRNLAFLVSPSGERVHRCHGSWHAESGEPLDVGGEPIRYGHEERLLLVQPTGSYSVFDRATRVVTPVAGVHACPRLAVRVARESGFLVALECPVGTELWRVEHDGTAFMEGTYPRLPPGYALLGDSELTPDGMLVQYVTGSRLPITNAIVERTLEGRSEIVFDEAARPPSLVMLHGGTLITGP
jgi:hypothetical protein